MNISRTDSSINFQSKIKFVPADKFPKFIRTVHCESPTAPLESSVKKDSSLWTYEVRTCTAGGVVDDDGCLGFHFYDCEENTEKIKQKLLSLIQTKNKNSFSALVLGAKALPGSTHSIPLFETVADIINRIIQPSTFKRHTNKFAETDLGYNSRTDTWFINTSAPENPMMPFAKRNSVTTLKSLLESFEKIYIAPRDRLFIGGREITKDICPEIFGIRK